MTTRTPADQAAAEKGFDGMPQQRLPGQLGILFWPFAAKSVTTASRDDEGEGG